jgi:hypothetical protein
MLEFLSRGFHVSSSVNKNRIYIMLNFKIITRRYHPKKSASTAFLK